MNFGCQAEVFNYTAIGNTFSLACKRTTKKFYRSIVFSKTPLTSFLKVGEHFQIYPCDFLRAPKSSHCHDFPLVIEYWINADEKQDVSSLFEDFQEEDMQSLKDYMATSTIQSVKLNQLARLLSAVTNHRIFQYGETEFKWGVPLLNKDINDLTEEEKAKLNNSQSQPIMGIYTYPEMWKDLQIINFSEQTHPNSNFFKHADYYLNDPLDDKTKEITFPKTIFQTVDKYFQLSTKTKSIVDAITHLICNGIDIRTKMKSVSFLSFVSAIETIVNYELKDKREDVVFECYDCQTIKSSPVNCHKCGRPIWGVKAKFKSFLKTYVSPSDDSVQKYNRIYNLRSDIIHNGMLLLGDEQYNWSKSHKGNSQYMTHLETMQLARLSLIHWLLLGANKQLIE